MFAYHATLAGPINKDSFFYLLYINTDQTDTKP